MGTCALAMGTGTKRRRTSSAVVLSAEQQESKQRVEEANKKLRKAEQLVEKCQKTTSSSKIAPLVTKLQQKSWGADFIVGLQKGCDDLTAEANKLHAAWSDGRRGVKAGATELPSDLDELIGTVEEMHKKLETDWLNDSKALK